MYWLYLLFALGALVMSMQTTSALWLSACLLAALGFFIAWMMGLYAARIGSRQRDESQMIDPAELRRLRELAEARKQAGQASSAEPPSL